MRILAVSASARVHLLGGMEDHLHTLVEGLARRGHEVTVLTARHPLGIEEEVVEGVRWVYVESGAHWLDPEWPRASVATARRLLAQERYDVVHSQSSGALALLNAGIDLPPIVLSLHGQALSIVKATLLTIAGRPTPRAIARGALDLPPIVRAHFRQGNWRRFRGCEATVPSCTECRPSRIAMSLEKDHVHVVRNGVDTDLFRPGDVRVARTAVGLPQDVPIAMGAGRLDRGKGMQFAIDALSRLPEFPDARLVLAGDGGKRFDFEELAHRLGVGDRVLFVGRQAPERVALLMRASDVVVFPSLLGESFGLVVAQGMASGRPVLGSNRGAIPEVMGRDGYAGVVIPAGRAGPLARELARLFADPELRARMGEHGRLVALRDMTIERMIDDTYEVYLTAVRRRGH